jgi:hypothetical protein
MRRKSCYGAKQLGRRSRKRCAANQTALSPWRSPPAKIDRGLSNYHRRALWAKDSSEGRFDHLPELSDDQIRKLRVSAAKARKAKR